MGVEYCVGEIERLPVKIYNLPENAKKSKVTFTKSLSKSDNALRLPYMARVHRSCQTDPVNIRDEPSPTENSTSDQFQRELASNPEEGKAREAATLPSKARMNGNGNSTASTATVDTDNEIVPDIGSNNKKIGAVGGNGVENDGGGVAEEPKYSNCCGMCCATCLDTCRIA